MGRRGKRGKKSQKKSSGNNGGLSEELLHNHNENDSDNDYDMESDSLSFAWKQLEGPSVTLSEDAPGLSSFKAGAGTYTFELTVTDNYGAATTGQARLAVMPEPNSAPEVAMSVYTRPASEE